MYCFFKYLGWVNITLLVLIITHFILRRVNKYGFKNKNKLLRRISAFMSKVHPYLTGLLLISAFFHGFNLAGGIRLHSGYIAFVAILLQASFGTLVKFKKKKPILITHRIIGLLLVASVFVHVILMKT
ncbi:MAG: hypothetical protein J7L77_04010 [Clostridiales bacterium]|nr:hypothetical protein [Clostridiales bacterium]